MEQGKIVYQNKGFIIMEYPRFRDFKNNEINRKDRRFRLRIVGDNQPEIVDCAKLVFYLLKNIVVENEFQRCKEIILDAIYKADNERYYPENEK